MLRPGTTSAWVALAAALAGTAAPAGALARAAPRAKHRPAATRPSPDLWATVDACNSKHKPNTIGVRASMPGDGHPEETMYVRFRVQYRDHATGNWLYISQQADSGFVSVGSAKYKARQAGRDFTFVRQAGQPPYRLRGVVNYEWRRGQRVLRAMHVVTTAGHHATTGADPRGFSAASCVLN